MKIFVIIGKSCAGKDTLMRMLLKSMTLVENPPLEQLVPYTTRNPRNEREKTSGDYHFVTDEEMNLLISSDRFVEVRGYEIVGQGIRRYATILPEEFDDKNYIMIGTVEVVEALKRRGFKNVHVIHITLPEDERFHRLITRTAKTDKNYEEACRRFLQDEEDFARVDKFMDVFTIVNNNAVESYCRLIGYLKKELKKESAE